MALKPDYEAFHTKAEELWKHFQLMPHSERRQTKLVQLVAPILKDRKDRFVPQYYFAKAKLIFLTVSASDFSVEAYEEEVAAAAAAVSGALNGTEFLRKEGLTKERKAWLMEQLQAVKDGLAERKEKEKIHAKLRAMMYDSDDDESGIAAPVKVKKPTLPSVNGRAGHKTDKVTKTMGTTEAEDTNKSKGTTKPGNPTESNLEVQTKDSKETEKQADVKSKTETETGDQASLEEAEMREESSLQRRNSEYKAILDKSASEESKSTSSTESGDEKFGLHSGEDSAEEGAKTQTENGSYESLEEGEVREDPKETSKKSKSLAATARTPRHQNVGDWKRLDMEKESVEK